MAADSAYAGVSSFGVSGTNGHCLAYGKNTCNSRGRGQKNLLHGIIQKLNTSEPKIIRAGNSWEEWQNHGRPHDTKPGAMYQVELGPDGSAIWREVMTPEIDTSFVDGPFYIEGSVNNWGMSELTPSADLPGLHTIEIEIGDEEEETFRIIAGEDPDEVLYPAVPRSTKRTAQILGPDKPYSDDDAWLIRGHSQQRFRIEFFVSAGCKTVTWIPLKS